jgi:hypothetical protein
MRPLTILGETRMNAIKKAREIIMADPPSDTARTLSAW